MDSTVSVVRTRIELSGRENLRELYRSSGLDGERGPDQDRAEPERELAGSSTVRVDSTVSGVGPGSS